MLKSVPGTNHVELIYEYMSESGLTNTNIITHFKARISNATNVLNLFITIIYVFIYKVSC